MLVTLLAVPRNLASNIAIEEDFKEVSNINNERTSDVEDDAESDYEPTVNLELQGNGNTNGDTNGNTNETETKRNDGSAGRSSK
jgi:hypothetical protein